MGLPMYLCRRLSLSSAGRKSSPAVRVATIAVALSVAVMVVAISVVIGFKREISERVTGFNADIVIMALPTTDEKIDDVSDNIINLTPTLRTILTEKPYITDISLQINMPAIFKTQDNYKGVYLKALDGRQLSNFLLSSLEHGDLPQNDSSVLISRRVANALQLGTGDKLPTYFLTGDVHVARLYISGIYNSHFDDYDTNFAFVMPEVLQKSCGLSPGQGTAISIEVDDFANVETYTSDLQRTLYEAYQTELIYKPLRIVNARSTGAAYFHWLDILDINVWVIIIIMTVVSCVTLISGMLIMMVDKVRFIALMSALGASRRMLSRVFVLLALRVALTGLAIGDIIGLGLVYLQKYTSILPLDPESYYIDFVPVAINWYSFILLNIGVLLVTFTVLLLPSRYVGRISPVHVLERE